MKIILAIGIVMVIGFLILGYLFVQWANSPEQIAALKKDREIEAARKIEDEKKRVEDEKRKIEIDREFEAKLANLQLVIDEQFADNCFVALDYKYQNFPKFKFEDHRFSCSSIIYKHSPPQHYFIFSKHDFGDFAAEMEFGIWGGDGFTGIFWDAQPNGQNDPTSYQAAYSSPNGLYVKTKEIEDFDLGSFFEPITTQKLRIERFGQKLRVSVNGQILFDKIVEPGSGGKLGITLGDRGIPRDNNESMSVDIKSFKVWK